MSELQIAWLELGIVGEIGIILILIGTMMIVFAKRKNTSCTNKTTGIVIKHEFAGDGRMHPVIEYTVGEEHYRVKKKFRGIKIKKVSGFPVPVESLAYEDEKGWLHVKIGPIANLQQYAEKIWPIGSEMTVYYNPVHPKKSYVERPISSDFTANMFIIMGLGIIVISVLIFFLMQL